MNINLLSTALRTAILTLFLSTACEVSIEHGDGSTTLSTPVVRLQEGSLTKNSFVVEWDGVDNAAMYAYSVSGGAEASGYAYGTRKQFTNLSANTTYKVEVMALPAEGSGYKNSYWSTPLYITTQKDGSQVDVPDTALDGYSLVWSDEFNGSQLDLSVWNIEVNGNGGGNNELQYYREENVSISEIDGRRCLTLTARKESYGGKSATSGRINSKNNKAFKYGRFDALIRMPQTADGLWPAYWMMGNDFDAVGWPRCGEIDVVEMGNAIGIASGTQDRYLNGACHWGYYKDVGGGNWAYPNYANSVTYQYSVQDGNFHLFSCVWDENALAMYIDLDKYPDAEPYFKMAITDTTDDWSTGNYFHKECFILFNLAVGGNFTGIWNIGQITALADGEKSMYVDYIRVYRKN